MKDARTAMTARTVDTGTEKLLAEIEDGVATITFNNPTKLNALSYDMQIALPPTLRSFQADPDVRVLVLTGAGNRAFVSGADISEFGEKRTSVEARAEYDRASGEAGRAWTAVEKPIIAMIRGYCIGGGLLTAMQADIRIASDDAQFGVPAARLGLGYGLGGVDMLSRLVGPAWASEILFTARRLSAAEAVSIGLINRSVPADELGHSVRELAGSISANAPLTIAACKAALVELRRPERDRDLARVAHLVEACFRSSDYLEGQKAFSEKRPPRFVGR